MIAILHRSHDASYYIVTIVIQLSTQRDVIVRHDIIGLQRWSHPMSRHALGRELMRWQTPATSQSSHGSMQYAG